MDRLGELRALYQGKHLAQARELYETNPGCPDPEWYFIGSLVYWHLGEYPLSRWAADYGLALKPQGEIRMKILYRLGTTEERLGAYGEAIEHLEECLEQLPAYPSLAAIMQGAVLYNTALAYDNRGTGAGNDAPARHYYERAANEFRREGMQEHLRACLQNIAWALCDAGQTGEAADLLDEAAPLCTTEQGQLRQTVVNAYQLLISGDRIRSLKMLEPLLKREDDSDAFIFSLSITALAGLGLHESNPEMLDKSGALLNRAMIAATKPGVDPRCWTVANRIHKRLGAILKEQARGA